jgi:hypothetical protein
MLFEPAAGSPGRFTLLPTRGTGTRCSQIFPGETESEADFLVFSDFATNTQLYHQMNQRGMRNQETGINMGQIRTDSTRRYECAHLICAYLLAKKKIRAVVTSREIALFHHLSRKSSQSISAMLNFLYTNQIRESRFGFYIRGTSPFGKYDYPHHYSIELIDEARGLL